MDIVVLSIHRDNFFMENTSITPIEPVFPRIHIVPLFPGNGGIRRRTVIMARPHHGIIGQFHEIAQGPPQGRAIAPRKVRPAAVADKKGVPGEKVPPGVEADPAGSVARRMEYRKNDISYREVFFPVKEDVHPPLPAFQPVANDPGAGQLFQAAGAGGMIYMAVGVKYVFDPDARFFRFFSYYLGFAAGVDDRACSARFTAYNIAKFIKTAYYNLPDYHYFSVADWIYSHRNVDIHPLQGQFQFTLTAMKSKCQINKSCLIVK